MGHFLVKQPDGRYAEWSTFCDNFTVVNCTREEMIEHRVSVAAEDARKLAESALALLDAGKFGPGCLRWEFDQLFGIIETVHGKKGLEKARQLFETED